jgi:hypothetical protein
MTVFPDLFDNYTRGIRRSLSPTVNQMCGYPWTETWLPSQAWMWAGLKKEHPHKQNVWGEDSDLCRVGLVSFAPSGTGLPFHFHEEVCGNLNLWGRKRWFFSKASPLYNPKHNTGRWVTEVLPAIADGTAPVARSAPYDDILECMTGPGDMVYVPQDWYHSTLAVGHVIGVAPHCKEEVRVPGLATYVLQLPMKRSCGMGPIDRMSLYDHQVMEGLLTALPAQFHVQHAAAMLPLANIQAVALDLEQEMRHNGSSATFVELGLAKRPEGARFAAEVDRAVEGAKRAIRLNPHYSETYYALATAHLYRGDIRQGIAAARRALQLDHQDYSSCRRLGVLLLAHDPPLPTDALAICNRCLVAVAQKLRETQSRECSLYLYQELQRLSDVVIDAAVQDSVPNVTLATACGVLQPVVRAQPAAQT